MTDAVIQRENSWHAIIGALNVMAMSQSSEPKVAEQVAGDAALVEEAVSGDDDSFKAIVDLHQSAIAKQMQRFSRDTAIIEELVHDVFVEAYVSLKSYRADSPLIHWLRKIAVRVGYRYWKRRSRISEKTVPLTEVESVGLVSDDEESGHRNACETLGNLLDCLPVRDRLVLTLIYWDGCSTAEAAELSGWSQAAVKVQAFRARKRLQQLIEESLV